MTQPAARSLGIIAHARGRKQDSRRRLLQAGFALVCERGFAAVSVEDIAAAAGVNRLTFYRHFANKGELAAAIYAERSTAAVERVAVIAARNWRDRAVVLDWIACLFAADREKEHIQRMFAQAFVETPALAEPARQTIRDIIAALGPAIPAFRLDSEAPAQRRRWLEASMLVFEILDQSRHAAIGTGFAADPLVMEILADRFLEFAGA